MQPQIIVLFVLIGLIGGYILYLSRRHPGADPDKLDKYRTLTPELLAAVPDDELVEAVIANILAKLHPRRPDPYREIPAMTQGRCSVYAVWLIGRELDDSDFEQVRLGPSARFFDFAAEGYALLGASRCEAIIRKSLETDD
ncbi:MAG: hypothetical protein FWE80_06745, partial [Oscillospiraceae bacterium]|nr:hypothetical protein [Oscillospiraceae bacterium]